jgi:hypothetical protein
MQLAGYGFVDFQAQGGECAHGAMSSEQCKSAGISTVGLLGCWAVGLLGCWAVWLMGGQALSAFNAYLPVHGQWCPSRHIPARCLRAHRALAG